jgi:integrase/recombinase XerC
LREPLHDPAVLTAGEVRRLFLAAYEDARDERRPATLAVLAVLSQLGLRVHELVALDLAQLDLASGTLVAVRGKSATVHDMPLNEQTIALLKEWLTIRIGLAPATEPALFVSSQGTRLSVRAVQRLLVRLRRLVGTAKHVTPHTLRHTAATLALTFGADLSTVADLLRHTDLNTTRRYLHLVDERRREAVRRLGAAIPEAILPQPGEVECISCGSEDLAKNVDAQYGLDVIDEAA